MIDKGDGAAYQVVYVIFVMFSPSLCKSEIGEVLVYGQHLSCLSVYLVVSPERVPFRGVPPGGPGPSFPVVAVRAGRGAGLPGGSRPRDRRGQGRAPGKRDDPRCGPVPRHRRGVRRPCEWYGPFCFDHGPEPSAFLPEGTHTVTMFTCEGVRRSDPHVLHVSVEPSFDILPVPWRGKAVITWPRVEGALEYAVYRPSRRVRRPSRRSPPCLRPQTSTRMQAWATPRTSCGGGADGRSVVLLPRGEHASLQDIPQGELSAGHLLAAGHLRDGGRRVRLRRERQRPLPGRAGL